MSLICLGELAAASVVLLSFGKKKKLLKCWLKLVRPVFCVVSHFTWKAAVRWWLSSPYCALRTHVLRVIYFKNGHMLYFASVWHW